MHFISYFRHFWNARKPLATTVQSAEKNDATTCLLKNLQQLCAVLPQGEAEVWLQSGQVNVSLHWQPEEKTPGNTPDKTQGPAGLYFLLNGQNEKAQVAELNEEETGQAETVQAADSPNHADVQANTGLSTTIETATRKDTIEGDETGEKPGRQLKTLKQMLNYLQLHYAFRYNRLTDRTECTRLSAGVGSDEDHQLHYQPADQRMLNSISLQVMQAGIPCWDRDIRRYVESADIPSYHPFTTYMEQLPQWDGKDRVTPLAKRVSDQPLWVNSFHRWMLAMTAQWMNTADIQPRANSVAPLLVSPQQGLGKSTFCRMLLPEELQDYFTESFDLTHPGAAEGKLASFGLINLDEFDRLPDSRMPQLKNLMQMERLNIRRAYKHNGEPLPRIASFIGTSNRRDLLTDRSGSRRFICVEVEHPIDCTTPIEYDQLYAQLKLELEHGARSWFSKQEETEIQQANAAFYRTTPAEELLEGAFRFAEPGEEGAYLLSAAQIYTSLKSKHPAALQDCTPLAFSKLLAQIGKRVHTRSGNGYWVKAIGYQ